MTSPITDIVDAILRYLHAHPDAMDSAEGIARWWLPKGLCADPELVEQALQRLREQGLVRRHEQADRHVLYSR